MRFSPFLHLGVVPLLMQLSVASPVRAAGEISQLTTSDQPATPFQYSIGGRDYAWGAGRNQIIEQFSVAGQSYGWATSADRVEIVRRDVAGVASGEPCGVFVEKVEGSDTQYQASYPLDASESENCDMAAMLASRVVNRGALNVFNNADPMPKNIERLDYLFDNGVLAPLDAASLAQAGHLVAEKSGNNAIRVAAVLELDVFGQPARYGDLVTVNPVDHGCAGTEICYGLTDLQHEYDWLESESLAPQSFPVLVSGSSEPVAMAFVSAEALGLAAGQRYYGFSFFADDVNADDHDLLDVTSFPSDTQDAYILQGDDADIYGGVSGYFVGEGTSTASGDIFKDEDGDGIRDENEAGFSAVLLTLFEDTDGNGVLEPGADAAVIDIDSAIDGSFTLPVLPDGNYFLLVDEADPDIPGGLVLEEGSNPQAFVISGSSPDALGFVFIDDDAVVPGADSGADTAGTATVNADGAGTATAGTATAGGDDSGADTAGTATAGGDDSGADTAGTATAGGDDSGADTAGSATAGGDDSGADTAGTATAGGDDSGADTAGTATAGGDDSGNDTDGTATVNADGAGTATAGTATSGGGDTGGGGDAGAETAGGDDSGMDPAGTATAGGDDSSTDAGGTATAGGDDSGTDTPGGGSGGSISGADGMGRPVAVQDILDVRQDTPTSIDVLFNDLPVTSDLTLVSAEQPLNGTVEIVDDEVLYIPNYGFVGEDPFIYTMMDAAGIEASGTVSATVFRFSDINGDDVNDFDQCGGCDSLVLETGLDGTGVGRMVPFTLLLLLSLLGFRRGYLATRARQPLAAGEQR